MYTIACRDMGIDCNQVASGATKDAAIAAGITHVTATHKNDPKVKAMFKMPEAEMMTMAMEFVKEA